MIIPGLNIFKYIQAHLLSCFEFGTIDQFRFESFEKAFSHRVIPTVAFPAHTLIYLIVLQQINGLFTGILDAPVRVKDHPFFKRSATIGHPDSRYDSAGSSQIIADRPPNEFAVEKINHACKIKESILTGDVSNVGHTCLHRFILFEITVQQVRRHLTVVGCISGYPKLLRELAAQTHLFHMSSHGCSGNIDSRCLQIFSQPGAAIASLGFEICIFNFPAKFHRLPFTFTHRVFKPAVITATRYIQYSTHHPNRPLPRVVILDKLKDQRSLVEMMPKAFFNMSRSVSASLRRFSSSATLPASPSRERTPLPGKLLSPRSRYSLRQRYNSAGEMPNSCARSETFFRSRLSLTAFSLNALS
jgi:hypothetical protein